MGGSKIERPFLSVAELAALLGVSTRTVYKLCWGKEIPYIKVGSSVRIHRDVVQAVLARGTRHPDADARGGKRERVYTDDAPTADSAEPRS